MTKKILWFDTETTGLGSDAGMIQLAGIIEIDGIIKDEFDFKCRPFPSDFIDDKACEIHKISKEQMQTFDSPQKVYREFVKLLAKHVDKFDKNDKFYPAGYNCTFDLNVVNTWFKKCGDNFWGSWQNWTDIDVLRLVNIMSLLDCCGPVFENRKLETVAKAMGIAFDGSAHDALADIKATRNVYIKLIDLLVWED